MPRYIDADKLTPIITQWNPSALIEERYYHEEQIINAPTVDAIPVEWIERSIPFQHPDDQDILISMIEEWRKENETHK